MAKRYVRATGKNSQGDITKLCNSGDYWSPRSKADAISDIEGGLHEYWVNWSHYPETKIRVVNGPTGKYLRTDRDTTSRNNLDDLPNC
ncbi:MAG TPA: DUF3892 domain-containing protein [Candidatus Sphingomonas excrementigallinarum]|nr:DUF3892 domain-containing protein [Candidatus Sphingomonas excrementigallinarum]